LARRVWRAVPGGSEEGGLDELVEFIASRASSSLTLASSSWTRVSSATRAARTAGERVSPAASSSWAMLMARSSPHIQDQTVRGAERVQVAQPHGALPGCKKRSTAFGMLPPPPTDHEAVERVAHECFPERPPSVEIRLALIRRKSGRELLLRGIGLRFVM